MTELSDELKQDVDDIVRLVHPWNSRRREQLRRGLETLALLAYLRGREDERWRAAAPRILDILRKGAT